MIIPLAGTAGDDVAVTGLGYRYREVGGSWGSWVSIPVPSHAPNESFPWSADGPDLGVGSYEIEIRAQDGDNHETVIQRSFTVVAGDTHDALTGITGLSFSSNPTVTAGADTRVGYRFTVGDDDILVNQLGVFMPAASPPRGEVVMIHRVSDGVIVAQASIATGANVWSWEALGSDVVLDANTAYTVSSARDNNAGRSIYLPTPEERVFDPSITFNRVVYGPSGPAMPATEFVPPDAAWAEDYLFMSFRHVE